MLRYKTLKQNSAFPAYLSLSQSRLKCFVLNSLCSKTKHLRRHVRGFDLLEEVGFSKKMCCKVAFTFYFDGSCLSYLAIDERHYRRRCVGVVACGVSWCLAAAYGVMWRRQTAAAAIRSVRRGEFSFEGW